MVYDERQATQRDSWIWGVCPAPLPFARPGIPNIIAAYGLHHQHRVRLSEAVSDPDTIPAYSPQKTSKACAVGA